LEEGDKAYLLLQKDNLDHKERREHLEWVLKEEHNLPFTMDEYASLKRRNQELEHREEYIGIIEKKLKTAEKFMDNYMCSNLNV
jgi:hypothetical protein